MSYIEKMCFVNWRFRSFVQYIYTQRQCKVTRKSHVLNIGQYLVQSERRTAETSTLNFMA